MTGRSDKARKAALALPVVRKDPDVGACLGNERDAGLTF
jgi:hypothetical protein